MYFYINYNCKISFQLQEMKKKADDEAQQAAALEEIRKKQAKDIETLQRQIEELNSINDKLSKSKKKLQSEVSKYNLDLFPVVSMYLLF